MAQYRLRGTVGGEPASGVVDFDTVPFDAIARHDRLTFEADRRRFLRFWIAKPEAVRLGVIRGGELTGWG